MSQLVTQAEFARLAGVNRSTVTRWLQNGRIKAEPNGLIDPEAAAAMRDATESPMPHHQARKAQFDEARQYQGTPPPEKTQQGATPAATADQISKEDAAHRAKVAMMREREWTAVQREIDARKAAGELVDVAKVRDAWRSAFILLRATIEALPPRAAPALASRRGDVTAMEHDLAGMLSDALNEAAAAFNRKLDGVAE